MATEKCRKFEDMFLNFPDDFEKAVTEKSGAVKAHLSSCPDCSRFIASLERVEKLALKDAKNFEKIRSEQGISKTIEKIYGKAESARATSDLSGFLARVFESFRLTPALASAAAVFFLSLSFYLFYGSGGSVSEMAQKQVPTAANSLSGTPPRDEKVEKLTGVVEFFAGGSWQTLSSDTPIHSGFKVRTHKNGACDLKLKYGSFSVNGETAATFESSRIRIETGSLNACFTPDKRYGSSPFTLEIPNAELFITGTAFLVTVTKNKSTISMKEGSVIVRSNYIPGGRCRLDSKSELTIFSNI